MIRIPFVFSLLTLVLAIPSQAPAHCEIPCGIYGDELRFKLLSEHIDTIEKSVKQIQALSKSKGKAGDANQLARWVANKEAHAEKFQQIVYQYFLNQRVKPVDKGSAGYAKYIDQLTLAHRLLVGGMKTKQTVDLKVTAKLRSDLVAFEKAYLGHGHK